MCAANIDALVFETNASSATHTSLERGAICAETVLNSKATYIRQEGIPHSFKFQIYI
jgi:hypothetical protein